MAILLKSIKTSEVSPILMTPCCQMMVVLRALGLVVQYFCTMDIKFHRAISYLRVYFICLCVCWCGLQSLCRTETIWKKHSELYTYFYLFQGPCLPAKLSFSGIEGVHQWEHIKNLESCS